jgi:N-acetylneuraminic acid mutarotase
MRQRFKTLLGISVSVVLAAACATDAVDPEGVRADVRFAKGGAEVSVAVAPSSSTVRVGETVQLTVTVSTQKNVQDGRTVTWSSSDSAIATVSLTGLVTGIAAGGPVTITASTGGKKAVTGTAIVTVIPAQPTWTTLVSESDAPGAPIYWCTNAPSDNALYTILGNGDYQPFTLWKFDLTTDTWSQISTTNYPLGTYRQIVHDPVNHRILTFWDGRGQVYAVNESGGAWQAVGSTGNSDDYYGSASFWNPVTGKLTAFDGYGFFAWKNTLASFDASTGAWSLETQSSLKPSPRFAATSAVDETGNAFFINSGEGYPTGSQFDGKYVYNDLWKLDLTTNTWTQLIAHDGNPSPTIGAGMDYVPSKNAIYRFGGSHGAGDPNYLADLEVAELSASTPAWSGVGTLGTAPSARNSPMFFYDAPRERLLVVAGYLSTGGVKLDVHALRF